MLTKTLLKYKIKQKEVYPSFVECTKESLKVQTKELLSLYENCANQTVGELEETVSSFVKTKGGIFEGLAKLLNERVSSALEGSDSDIFQQRLKTIEEAQKLRQEKVFSCLDEFYESLEERLQKKISLLQDELYSDLPEFQKIKSFEQITSENLLHRYNVALVQGLLLQAKSIHISLNKNQNERTVACHRFLFRQMKFHRLLCAVTEDTEDQFAFTLSGPLSVFEQRQTYGIRFATFFPHLLKLPSWKLEAQLALKSNSVVLKLDDTLGLKSHYTQEESYIPKELLFFTESFNKKASLWQASISSRFINMGEKSYCFPDIELKQDDGHETLYIELFHRWHKTQLLQRLEGLKKQKEASLILGVCTNIMKKKDLDDILQQSAYKYRVFSFKDFPSSAKLLKFLEIFDSHSQKPQDKNTLGL